MTKRYRRGGDKGKSIYLRLDDLRCTIEVTLFTMYDLAAQCTPHGKLYFVHYTWYMNSHFFCHLNRLFQCAELVVHLLQFIFILTACYNTSSGLEPEFIVAAYKSTDGDCLV